MFAVSEKGEPKGGGKQDDGDADKQRCALRKAEFLLLPVGLFVFGTGEPTVFADENWQYHHD